MVRPLRLALSGGLYHVTARGDGREDIYLGDADREAWLEVLGQVCRRFNWVCHAWCQMSNHDHLLLETPEANLATGTRQLNGVYTQRFNRAHGRVGHVFQGRYKAILVERDSYLLELARYVVLNPLRAKMVKRLDAWPWSSYLANCGHSAAPGWLLDTGAIWQAACERGLGGEVNRPANWSFAIVVALLLITSSWHAHAAAPAKGPLTLAGTKTEVWGSYKIRHMLFPREEWNFVVIVVPKEVGQGTLIRIAKDFYAKYPNTRARFFSDKRHIRQYVDRDRYVNDSTGRVREVKFPDSEWVRNHFLGNINNRSEKFNRDWMLEDRYGNKVSLLPSHFGTTTAQAGSCDEPKTQLQINRCASSALDAETASINYVYNRYRAGLDPDEKKRIKAVQLAWIKYRDLACEFEASGVEGGSMQPYVLTQCLIEQTHTRRKQLEALLRCDSGVTPGANCNG